MADLGNGVSVTFANGTNASEAWTTEVATITFPGGSREAVDTSHLGTSAFRTYMPNALIDPGEVAITYRYDGSSILPTINSTSTYTLTISVPAANGSTSTNTYTASAFVTDSSVDVSNDDLMEASVTLKLTGAYTHS